MDKDKRYWWAIFLLAIFLRCIFLERRGIIYDDAFTILLSQQSFGNIIKGTAADTMPPLFYFLLHFWMKISAEIWFLRLLSIIFDLGSILLFYLIIRRLAGYRVGLLAFALAAISPLQIYHAQDIRMYAAAQFFLMLYLWFFIKIANADKAGWKNGIGLVLSGACALYSHNLMIFALIVPDVYLLARKEFRKLLSLLELQFIIGMIFLPWLLYLPGQIAKIQGAFWTPQPGIAELIQSMTQMTSSLPQQGFWLYAAVFLAVFIFVFVFLELWRNRTDYQNWSFIFLASFLPPFILFTLSYLIRPVFVTRGFLASALFFLGLAGYVIGAHPQKIVRYGIIAVFTASAIIGLVPQYQFDQFPRSPFREAAAELENRVNRGDVILHDNKLSYFPMRIYSPNLPLAFLPDEAGSANDTLAVQTQAALGVYPETDLEHVVGSSQRLYFVVFQEAIDEYRQLGHEHPVISYLDSNMQLVSQHAWNDLWIYQYDHREN